MVISVADKEISSPGAAGSVYEKRRTMSAQMSFADFLKSTESAASPVGLSRALEALWLDARGDWDAAHDAAQAAGGRDGAWVHAYLHRKEGDEMNAGYWYARAGQPAAAGDLQAEWAAIARALLKG
jgi:hypothetical protein